MSYTPYRFSAFTLECCLVRTSLETMLQELFAPLVGEKYGLLSDDHGGSYQICPLFEENAAATKGLPCVVYGAASEDPEIMAWLRSTEILGFRGKVLLVAFNEREPEESGHAEPERSAAVARMWESDLEELLKVTQDEIKEGLPSDGTTEGSGDEPMDIPEDADLRLARRLQTES